MEEDFHMPLTQFHQLFTSLPYMINVHSLFTHIYTHHPHPTHTLHSPTYTHAPTPTPCPHPISHTTNVIHITYTTYYTHSKHTPHILHTQHTTYPHIPNTHNPHTCPGSGVPLIIHPFSLL